MRIETETKTTYTLELDDKEYDRLIRAIDMARDSLQYLPTGSSTDVPEHELVELREELAFRKVKK